jgi:hypothetical protein
MQETPAQAQLVHPPTIDWAGAYAVRAPIAQVLALVLLLELTDFTFLWQATGVRLLRSIELPIFLSVLLRQVLILGPILLFVVGPIVIACLATWRRERIATLVVTTFMWSYAIVMVLALVVVVVAFTFAR